MSERQLSRRGRDAIVPLALAAAGMTVGGLTTVLTRRSAGFSFASDARGLTLLLLPGVALIGVGAFVWASGRGSRLGLLLTLAGVTWFLAEWDSPAAGSPAVFTVGLVAHATCASLVAHVALADQRGRVTSWLARAVVLLGYLILLGLVGLAPTLFYEPSTQGCFSCPANLVVREDAAGRAHYLGVLGMRAGLAWTFVALSLICWLLARSSPTARRVMAPVAVPGLAFLSCLAWMLAMSLDRPYLGSAALDRWLWTVEAAALVAMAAGTVWGILRARRAHRRIARLVMDLDRLAPSEGLRESLAEMLSEPGLVIAYPRHDDRYVDANGYPVSLNDDQPATRTPLRRDGREIALLRHRPGLLDDPTLVQEIVSAAHLGLENERLMAEGHAQLRDLRASRVRIVQAGDEERRRLERDLHDGAQQRLVGLLLGIRLLSGVADPTALADAEASLRAAIDELRELARGLFPVALRDYGLVEALSGLTETSPLLLRKVPHHRFQPVVETTAYLLVAKAAATGDTIATITAVDSQLVIEIESTLTPDDLHDLAERVHALDGSLQVMPLAAGGTCVEVRIPVPAM